ncbi:DsbA family protein [Jannaschia formosa]|uniref:DsbA family protein n=1 Tax=Jannaschia formosa TaxID=2259592 RepID=UPI000E1B9B16|nr:DsbA family protein [Jannaschia formosa]TFL16868.1 hypothetical protein DR046_17850 [Jannaschia formosa]
MTARALDRRTVLAFGLPALAVAGGAALWPRLKPLPTEPIPGLPGFRRLAWTPKLTAVQTLALGLDTPAAPPPAPDPAAALPPDALTFFTSGGCPLCAPQWEGLPALGLPLHIRPLAFFGPTSERAARALIAAGEAAPHLHDRLVATAFRTEDPFIEAVATEALGAGAARAILARMDAPETTARLAENHTLAARLGLPGTPATLVRRTLAVGLTPAPVLARLARA